MKRALLGCAVAALLLFVAPSQRWATEVVGPFRKHVTGADLAGSLAVFGLIALAGAVAVLAARGRARIPVGLALTASGATAAATVLSTLRDLDDLTRDKVRTAGVDILVAYPVHRTVWPYVALAGGALLALTGVVVTLRGPSWTAMPAKYDAPAAPASEADLWSALDRGEDPTERPNTIPE